MLECTELKEGDHLLYQRQTLICQGFQSLPLPYHIFKIPSGVTKKLSQLEVQKYGWKEIDLND